LYNFIIKAWVRSYIHGRRAENMRRYSAGRLNRVHPYTLYVGGAILCLALSYSLLGVSGVIAYIALSCFASSQLLLIDYVQHYGLIRKTEPSGKLEKMSHHHSWNAPFFYSSRMTLNAPNHSDHHTNPSKPYYELTSKSDIPTLPHSMTVMAVCALVPSVWFTLMNTRALSWR
jgi:alkane 1-monooxygenase